MPLITIVIPTRNRPELLKNAVSSLVDQDCDSFEIIVSDNSTAKIASMNVSYVDSILDRRINYVRPPKEMAMVEHWNWAAKQANGDYVAFLTDRMVFKVGAIKLLADKINKHDPTLLTYFQDRLVGVKPPYTYERRPFTNSVFEVNSSAILDACHEGVISRIWPRMLNSICKKNFLDDMEVKYGAIFSGLSPDYSFCFQAIGLLNSFHLLDSRILISAGHDVSNGFSFNKSGDSAVKHDFINLAGNYSSDLDRELFESKLIHWSVPVPYWGEHLEYLRVKQFYSFVRFPDINYECFVQRASGRIRQLEKSGVPMQSAWDGLEALKKSVGISFSSEANEKIAFSVVKGLLQDKARRIRMIFRSRLTSAPTFGSVMEARAYDNEQERKLLPVGSSAHFWKDFYGSFDKSLTDYGMHNV